MGRPGARGVGGGAPKRELEGQELRVGGGRGLGGRAGSMGGKSHLGGAGRGGAQAGHEGQEGGHGARGQGREHGWQVAPRRGGAGRR